MAMNTNELQMTEMWAVDGTFGALLYLFWIQSGYHHHALKRHIFALRRIAFCASIDLQFTLIKKNSEEKCYLIAPISQIVCFMGNHPIISYHVVNYIVETILFVLLETNINNWFIAICPTPAVSWLHPAVAARHHDALKGHILRRGLSACFHLRTSTFWHLCSTCHVYMFIYTLKQSWILTYIEFLWFSILSVYLFVHVHCRLSSLIYNRYPSTPFNIMIIIIHTVIM